MAFLDLLGPDGFAVGRLTYSDVFAGDYNARIVVPITVENTIATTAILDTGAPWCILNPYTARRLNLERRADCLKSPRSLHLRGSIYQGQLCQMSIFLEAEEGIGTTVEVTIFIPELHPNEAWKHP